MQTQSNDDKLGLLLVTLDIQTERKAQDEKWGQQNHHFERWLAILMEEIGEMSKAFLDKQFKPVADGTNFRTEMVQSAAVLHAMIECGDRNGWFAADAMPYNPESWSVTPMANPVMPCATIIAKEGNYSWNKVTEGVKSDSMPF